VKNCQASSSDISWEDATKGVAKAAKTINHIRSVYVKMPAVSGGEITEYRVN
jgi:flavin-binding protein dodecin